ncbi:MAG: VOC family protein [Planctomycetota bacterium]
MTDQNQGRILWHDLTVPEAETVRDFYRAVVGWRPDGVDMGGYEDFNMNTPDGQTQAGVCHARGVNTGIPPVWMVYIKVENLDHALERCVALNGRIVNGPIGDAGSRICIIEDPAGAVCALAE